MSKKNYDYLNNEREKLWAEVVDLKASNQKSNEAVATLTEICADLQIAVDNKTSDYERSAKNSSGQVTRYKNRAGDAAKNLEQNAKEAAEVLEQARRDAESLAEIEKETEESRARLESFQSDLDIALQSKESLVGKLEELESSLTSAQELLKAADEASASFEQQKEAAETISTKINSLHSQIAKKGKELNTLHDEVFGYTVTDEETGEATEAPGLKGWCKSLSVKASYEAKSRHKAADGA